MRSSFESKWFYLLLAIPLLITLSPVLYNFKEPALLGLPFFYCFNFGLILFTALITFIVYLLNSRS